MSIRLLAHSPGLCGGSVETLPSGHILQRPQNKMHLHQNGQQGKPDGLNSARAGSLPRFVWVFHVHHCITAVLLLLLSRSQPHSPCMCSWTGERPCPKSSTEVQPSLLQGGRGLGQEGSPGSSWALWVEHPGRPQTATAAC